VIFLSQWDKLIDRILEADRNLRFDELAKVLKKIGYTKTQPKGGGSHYIFRAPGLPPISIPKSNPINKAYIELVREAVIKYLGEVSSDE
jgi:predicted RNA binding protein YcfA (HicA-like mRNA interferase family)